MNLFSSFHRERRLLGFDEVTRLSGFQLPNGPGQSDIKQQREELLRKLETVDPDHQDAFAEKARAMVVRTIVDRAHTLFGEIHTLELRRRPIQGRTPESVQLDQQIGKVRKALAAEAPALVRLGPAAFDMVIESALNAGGEEQNEQRRFFADIAQNIAREHPGIVPIVTARMLRATGDASVICRDVLVAAGPAGAEALIRIVDGRAWEDLLPASAQSPALRAYLARRAPEDPEGARQAHRLFSQLTVPTGTQDRRPGVIFGAIATVWRNWHREYQQMNGRSFIAYIAERENINSLELLRGLRSTSPESRSSALLVLNGIPSVADRMRVIGLLLTENSVSRFFQLDDGILTGICYVCRDGQIVESAASIETFQEQLLSLGQETEPTPNPTHYNVRETTDGTVHTFDVAADEVVQLGFSTADGVTSAPHDLFGLSGDYLVTMQGRYTARRDAIPNSNPPRMRYVITNTNPSVVTLTISAGQFGTLERPARNENAVIRDRIVDMIGIETGLRNAHLAAEGLHREAASVNAVFARMEQADVTSQQYSAFAGILLHTPEGCIVLQRIMERRDNDARRQAVSSAIDEYFMVSETNDFRFSAHQSGSAGGENVVRLLGVMLGDPLPVTRLAALRTLAIIAADTEQDAIMQRTPSATFDPIRKQLQTILSQSDLSSEEQRTARESLDNGIERHSFDALITRARDSSLSPQERVATMDILVRETNRDQTLSTRARRTQLVSILDVLQELAVTDPENRTVQPVRVRARYGLVSVISNLQQRVNEITEGPETTKARQEEEVYREGIVADGLQRISLLSEISTLSRDSGFKEAAGANIRMIQHVFRLLQSTSNTNVLSAIRFSKNMAAELPWDNAEFVAFFIAQLIDRAQAATRTAAVGSSEHAENELEIRREIVDLLQNVVEQLERNRAVDEAGIFSGLIEQIHQTFPETIVVQPDYEPLNLPPYDGSPTP